MIPPETIRLTRERDEARAIARRLAAALERVLERSCHDELETLGTFAALPWAKEEEEPA